MTILQSWSQGVQVWGRDGMRKLWSASNVAIYGGGVKEPEFLNELSQMIGDYDRRTTSTSVGRGTRSTSHGVQRERTLDVLTSARCRAAARSYSLLAPPPPSSRRSRG